VRELHVGLQAVMFFTRFPVPRWTRWDENMTDDLAPWFPIVGLIVGGACASSVWVGLKIWPASVPAVLAIITSLVVTGAFHEDGLADTFDALGGKVPAAKALDIMKDSRLGTYGAAALASTMLLRWTALTSLVDFTNPFVLLCSTHVISRLGIAVLPTVLPYARDVDSSKVKPVARTTSPIRATVAVTLGLIIVALLQRDVRTVVALIGITVAITASCGIWFRSRIGGYTGDTLGATQQLCELGALLTLSGATWIST
jgi:adenosylcobinamide-GDP ribazoletransferase